jgi:hypothetical protein
MASFFVALGAILLMGAGVFAYAWRLGGKLQQEARKRSNRS